MSLNPLGRQLNVPVEDLIADLNNMINWSQQTPEGYQLLRQILKRLANPVNPPVQDSRLLPVSYDDTFVAGCLLDEHRHTAFKTTFTRLVEGILKKTGPRPFVDADTIWERACLNLGKVCYTAQAAFIQIDPTSGRYRIMMDQPSEEPDSGVTLLRFCFGSLGECYSWPIVFVGAVAGVDLKNMQYNLIPPVWNVDVTYAKSEVNFIDQTVIHHYVLNGVPGLRAFVCNFKGEVISLSETRLNEV